MRQELIIPSLRKRVTNRANLSILLLVGGMFCLFRIMTGPPGGVTVSEFAFPFLLLLGYLAFSPIPWQWTGDERPMTGLSRGFIQALLFNLAWVAVILLVHHLTGPDRPPGAWSGPHPDPGGGPGGPGDLGGMGGPGGPGEMNLHRGPMFPSLGLALVNTAFAIVFGWVFADKEATENRERSMAGLLRQSQSRALQNQLEPHVLYNALNGLAELVHEDPLAAEEMISRLADLYRMLTHHSEADFVPLMKERILVEAYLSMEQMRLGERLRIEWDWPAWADAVILPPLLLQPLVENAIKHGISPCDAGGELKVTCWREDGRIAMRVANTGRPLAAEARKGIGLDNLRARLALWLESGGTFTLTQEDNWTVAEVRWIAERK